MNTAIVKKWLVIALLTALSATALLAIVVIGTGWHGQRLIGPRLLGTTFFWAIFSLTGLCAAVALEQCPFRAIGVVGVASSGWAALHTTVVLWADMWDGLFDQILPRFAAAPGIAALAVAWCSLVLVVVNALPTRRARGSGDGCAGPDHGCDH